MIFVHNNSSREQLTPDKGGEFGSESHPAAPVLSLRDKFDAIAVRIIIDGQSLDVAVPDETYGKERAVQAAIAEEVGGEIATPLQNEAVVDYLLDREAYSLLAREQAGTITEEEKAVLSQHREKWQEDPEAQDRAEEAGEITDQEAALLRAYRMNLISDSEGGVVVDEVSVHLVDSYSYPPFPFLGALVVCPSAKSK